VEAVVALLAAALALTACAPITPAAAPAAAPAGGVDPSAAAVELAPETAEGIQRAEEYLDQEHERGVFSGAALIAQDGKVIWSKAWGMADREQETANTMQTINRIYEMTTQFTAAAMLLLEQEGKLSLDDPICNYLDDCPEAWQPVSIHHLLSHTSGIPSYFDVADSEALRLTREGATPEEIVALFHEAPLAFEPGAQRSWSYSGFVLAGLIIERVTGQPYGDFVEQRLFGPLGMAHSGYGDPPEGLAVGYRSATDKTPAPSDDPTALYAAGGLYSTAEDLFRWNEALYNGQVLNEAQLQKMLTSHATTEWGEGSGYGIVVGEKYGRPFAHNAGGYDGYGAAIIRYVDDRITSVVIGNQIIDSIEIREEMDRRFFGAE
jgi:CubicO group peptidase (beta-lactamase class C family)